MRTEYHIKYRYLVLAGRAPTDGESIDRAFDRLSREDPDFLPVPRADESVMDAVREVVRRADRDAAGARTPEVVLVDRQAWSGQDGASYVRERFEIRGGDVALDWAKTLRPPEAPWCSVTLHDDDVRIGSFGGSTWPMAWPALFWVDDLFGRRRGRATTILTDAGAAMFAAARLAYRGTVAP